MGTANRRKRIGIVGAVVLVVAGGAWAAGNLDTSSDDGFIYGCVGSGQGQLRVVASAAECRSNERALTWNVRGPTGARGPEGPPGPRGADGPPGLPASLTIESLEGAACTVSQVAGAIHVTTALNGDISLRCVANIDLQGDSRNCGAVGNDVSRLPNANGVCVAGHPAITTCDAGWSDFDGAPANGCEVCANAATLAERINALVANVQSAFVSSEGLCLPPGSVSGRGVTVQYCSSAACGTTGTCPVSAAGSSLSYDQATGQVTGVLNATVELPVRVSVAGISLGSCTFNATVSQLAVAARVVARGPGVTLSLADVRYSGGIVDFTSPDCGSIAATAQAELNLLRSLILPLLDPPFKTFISNQSLTFACE